MRLPSNLRELRQRNSKGQFAPGEVTPVMERFWSKVRKTDTCWLWLAATVATGYGCISNNKRIVLAHRLSYESLVGPIPEGMELDHLCRNPSCVNPAHLEPVTHRENGRRGRAGWNMRAKTECPAGHSYDLLNTYFWRGFRLCRACRKSHRPRHAMAL